MARLTRRRLLQLGAAGCLIPRLARAAEPDDRVFLFLHVRGGWDPAFVFTPLSGNGAYEEPGASVSSAGGLTYVDSPWRPAVGDFFGRYGADLCLVHGLEVPSVAHERCTQLLWTGETGTAPDWPTRIAGDGLAMPHLVLEGPVFAGDTPERVVRVGDDNQLPKLLDQELEPYDRGLTPLTADAQALIDAHVRARADAGHADSARDLHAQRYAASLAGLDQLADQAGALNFRDAGQGCTRDYRNDIEVAFDAFEAGVSRCVMLQHRGWCNQGWDTHQNLAMQSDNFEDLFFNLLEIQDALSRRSALKERLVLVVASEMGRHPKLNAWGGKDHWTWTSAMLMGSGIRGGHAVGGLDAYGRGERVDLATGAVSSGGVALTPGHLGATLLRLAGLDAVDDTLSSALT